MLRVNGDKLENVVEAGYGQSTHFDVKVLTFNPEKNVFEGRVWDGKFGPGDNTTWLEVPFATVEEQFGREVAMKLARAE